MNIDIRGACMVLDEQVPNHSNSTYATAYSSIRNSLSEYNYTQQQQNTSSSSSSSSNSNSSIDICNNSDYQNNVNSKNNNNNNDNNDNSRGKQGININSIQNSLDLNISQNQSQPTTPTSTSPPKSSSSIKDKPIILPNQSSPIKHFALDIGGTLAKLVYFVQDDSELGGKLHFIKFQTANIDDCFNFIIENRLHLDQNSSAPKLVRVTGGGAYKYADMFEKKLGCKLVKADEMQCLIWGTNFLLHNIERESYIYDHKSQTQPKVFTDKVDNPYPYLLVQIGSGVSIIKVDSETSFQRVDGTSLGGGTFWGLCSLLTGVTDFDEMLELTKHGQSNNVDLVVGDIYGTDYSKVGLSSDTIASSFGKIIYKHNNKSENADGSSGFKKEDIAQSLLKMVSNNIGQIAYLNSQRYGLNRIYFGGFFIRDHPNTMQRISFAIDFWSKGKTKASFLVHDGYLGALGAFLSVDADEKSNQSILADSWWKRTTRELQKIFFNSSIRKSHSPSNSLSTSRDSLNTSPNNSVSNFSSSSNKDNHNNHINSISNITSNTTTTATTTTNSTVSSSKIVDESKEFECDCGCEFCEGLVCKAAKD
ncbi:pantothenate kinase [Tieghemostelium lacteum]|uniref:pantothenate kinase n=1 Tax=Tieghemostelium lacteum TaxID=361077 RepID=A0A152A0M7_TIELA|nr:pantothenate kinase [Tieghemostelium lacteum]|eukprot:KYQ99797.1 pantothenate kinase [Tieghemostelium lacteum]